MTQRAGQARELRWKLDDTSVIETKLQLETQTISDPAIGYYRAWVASMGDDRNDAVRFTKQIVRVTVVFQSSNLPSDTAR